jgi:CBS domain-containing protein
MVLPVRRHFPALKVATPYRRVYLLPPMASPPPAGASPGRVPRVAADLMDPRPPVVAPSATVGEVARLLLERHLSGVPVMAETGEMLGLVTQADLVSRHAHVHFPFYLNVLGGVIPLGGERHFREDVRRIAGRTAADIMTTQPHTVQEDAPLDDVATQLAEGGIDPLVVVRGDRLAGLITRADLVRLVAMEEAAALPGPTAEASRAAPAVRKYPKPPPA